VGAKPPPVAIHAERDNGRLKMFRGLLGQNGSRLRIQSDEELCRLAASRDVAAFHELFDRYWDQVFRLTFAIVRSEAEAEDVAQSVFVELHCRAKEFDAAKGRFCSWLLYYAYTRAIDQKRYLVARKYYDQCDFDDLDFACLPEAPWPLFRLSCDERSHLVEQLLGHLNERQRSVIEAYFLCGQSLQEIAEVLNETHGNTRHLLYRGLAKLREVLQRAPVQDRVEKPAAALNTSLKGIVLARARAL
jgi:RNA polymerase sigma-70 factor (ECF subfamily)